MDEIKTFSNEQYEQIVTGVGLILNALGRGNDSGTVNTPARVAKMYTEMLEGMLYTNQQIADMFSIGKLYEVTDAKDLVLMKDMEMFSFCEHHLALMYDMKISVGYIPDGKVLGLSKIVRIVDMVCKRLQLQERIGIDIADVIEKAIGTKDVMVVIEAKHSCVTARGIKKPAVTNTALVRGLFKESPTLRAEVYSLLGK